MSAEITPAMLEALEKLVGMQQSQGSGFGGGFTWFTIHHMDWPNWGVIEELTEAGQIVGSPAMAPRMGSVTGASWVKITDEGYSSLSQSPSKARKASDGPG